MENDGSKSIICILNDLDPFQYIWVTIDGLRSLINSSWSKLYPPHGSWMCRRPQFVNGEDVTSIPPFAKWASKVWINSCSTSGWHPVLVSSTCLVPIKRKHLSLMPHNHLWIICCWSSSKCLIGRSCELNRETPGRILSTSSRLQHVEYFCCRGESS